MCEKFPVCLDRAPILQYNKNKTGRMAKGAIVLKRFLDKDFLLTTKTAKELYRRGAEKTPIFDWHCHLSPKEIYENRQPADIAELWLAGDHYKWRLMRSCGVDEAYVTGTKPNAEKFRAFAESLPFAVGNPMYHWTHLELQRYFGVEEPLSGKTAADIYRRCNEKIRAGDFSPRALIARSNVRCVCTTDDPADTLEYHRLLQKETGFACRVLPAFRPDKALHIEQPAFIPWIAALEKAVGREIRTFSELKAALTERMDLFDSLGCCASDHSFAYVPYCPATDSEVEKIFKLGLIGGTLTTEETDKYRTALLRFLGAEYARRGWVMELHIGAMRNNNRRMFERLGPDTGFDSINDYPVAEGLSGLLDALERKGSLPRTVLFALNPKDNYVLGAMLGNFQSSECPSKIQFGSAWWFNDNYTGMREQLQTLANLGVLGKFVGMVTDSRSFLSYPRHEYFRRILCELLGDWVEEGKYPNDLDFLSQTVADISYYNAERYFGLHK